MPEEIRSGVYELSLGDRYRVFLLDGDRPTLVDTGLPSTADELLDGIEAVGIEPELVVITHGDGDHIGALPTVIEEYDVSVHVPEQTDLDVAIDESAVERYGDGDRVGPFEAVHVPGHSDDNHALVDEERGILVPGDAVSGADQRGLPQGYLLLPPAVYSEDLNEAEESLERLLAYEFDAALTFHGSPVLSDADERLRSFVEFDGKP